MKNLSFSTDIFGQFSGKLVGPNDFTGYRVSLLTMGNKVLMDTKVNRDGSFSIEGFDIGFFNSFQRYTYKVYTPNGFLVIENDLN